MKLSDVSKILLGEIVTFRHKDELYADTVSGFHLEWRNDSWVPTEVWTSLYPEMPGHGDAPRPADILDVFQSRHSDLQNPNLAGTPKYKVGDTIWFDGGDGPEHAEVLGIQLWISDHMTELNYLVDEENAEEIPEEYLLPDYQPPAPDFSQRYQEP